MNPLARLRRGIGGLIRSPLFWIVFAAILLRLPGLAWGLPASDGWDDDGVAPRNYLVGLALTYQHGAYFTYPPLHMFILALLTAPGLVVALAHAHSFAKHDVISEFIRVPYMTYFAIVARLVSIAMSATTIVLIGKIAELIAGRRAGICAAAACALNAPLIYYGVVTNLDGPYTFWSVLSLWFWMQAMIEHDTKKFWPASLTAAAAIATKDQAYAVFLPAVPIALLLWLTLDIWARENVRRIATTLLAAGAVAATALLAVDGALTNPAGFARRVAFLTGPASQDFTAYRNDLTGRLAILQDIWTKSLSFYPAIGLPLALAGMAIHWKRTAANKQTLIAGLLPLLAVLSVTITFNLVVLRTETRFLLPQTVLLAVYIGIAVDRLIFSPNVFVRWPAILIIAPFAFYAIYDCLGIDAAFINDPRYDAERWLGANVQGRDTIEAYGLNVYLPRFPDRAIVTRLDSKPIAARNPLPNVTEISPPFGAIAQRNPKFIVVSSFWVRNFLPIASRKAAAGHAVPKVQQADRNDRDARAYFSALYGNRLAYRLVHASAYRPSIWPPVTISESLAQAIDIFERFSVQNGRSSGPPDHPKPG